MTPPPERAEGYGELRERLIDWLAARANDYLIWVHERERRGMPRCDECRAPLIDCSCEADARRYAELDSAFDAGIVHERERRFNA